MEKYSNRRFRPCTDETVSSQVGIKGGLRYHVYDVEKRDTCDFDEQEGPITSRDEMIKRVDQMNQPTPNSEFVGIPQPRCMRCKKNPKPKHFRALRSEYERYANGEHIQVMQSLTECDRETLITGFCSKCWTEIFEDMEE